MSLLAFLLLWAWPCPWSDCLVWVWGGWASLVNDRQYLAICIACPSCWCNGCAIAAVLAQAPKSKTLVEIDDGRPVLFIWKKTNKRLRDSG
jgi:hypothetical protein